jgi:hypothetical protein
MKKLSPAAEKRIADAVAKAAEAARLEALALEARRSEVLAKDSVLAARKCVDLNCEIDAALGATIKGIKRFVHEYEFLVATWNGARVLLLKQDDARNDWVRIITEAAQLEEQEKAKTLRSKKDP